MTWKPTPEQWALVVELMAENVVGEDEIIFALKVARRFDPAKHNSVKRFYLWCKSRNRNLRRERRKREPTYSAVFQHELDPVEQMLRIENTDTDAREAVADLEAVREAIGPIGYAVLNLRHGEGLSVTQTAKRLGISRESAKWIETEAMRRASSVDWADK